ncbi:division/cell wall cluster transcriptional repressor MraZ [Tropicimonas sp. IMCC34043]|uniref:division/cell wall cluster transcriptional repressor MraZ n=1 Tax=Tropicimonas sp. IMCC34043 TaxID=2248760 RepID=UPI000E27722D|nr:division/cell wall cluster transcriptional repressor MraZ [Tropicimonas sp. IMCC34043]
MFRGQGRHKIDAKGRVSIPATFRRVLEANDPDWTDGLAPNLVIHYGIAARDGCLECYTMAAASEVDAKIAALQRGSENRRALEAYFNAQSLPASVDDTGRLVLSQSLRDMIGLKDEALFVAASDTFKIWNPERYEHEVAPRTEVTFAGLKPGQDPLTLLDGGGI